MKFFKILVYLCPLVFLCCFERYANINNPKDYNSIDLQFQYPSNWRITKDSQNTEIRYILVESPGDAIVTIQIYSLDSALELGEYVKKYSELTRKKIPTNEFINIESSNTEVVINDQNIINETVNLSVLGIDVPHIRIYKRVNSSRKACFLIAQVATEDKQKVIDGFKLIFSSLKINK